MWQPPSLEPDSVFHALDVDGCGALTPAQVEAALDLYQVSPPSDSEWQQVLDTTGDDGRQQRASQDAFCRFVEARMSQSSDRERAGALFALLQPPNGADRLTPQDLAAAALAAGIEDLGLEEATDMVTVFDNSSNGTIGVSALEQVLRFDS